jgi:L-gulonate 3-dehydrogenase
LCTMPSVVIGSIEYEGDFEKAVEDVDYVQECGPEILDVKQDLFTRLDEISSPKTVLASSTSGFMASQFSAHIPGRHRVLVVHPVNPPHLVPLVEISPSEWTDPDVTKTAHDIMSAIGQTPVTVQKEIPGFILNRLQGALLNEALRLAQGGFATPEDIDKTVRDGLGLRWSFMGPFETIDLNAPAGLADYAKRYGPMYRDMAQSQSDVPGWHEDAIAPVHNARREELNIEDLTKRQYWRDRQLAALVAHKQKQDQ